VARKAEESIEYVYVVLTDNDRLSGVCKTYEGAFARVEALMYDHLGPWRDDENEFFRFKKRLNITISCEPVWTDKDMNISKKNAIEKNTKKS